MLAILSMGRCSGVRIERRRRWRSATGRDGALLRSTARCIGKLGTRAAVRTAAPYAYNTRVILRIISIHSISLYYRAYNIIIVIIIIFSTTEVYKSSARERERVQRRLRRPDETVYRVGR